MDIIKSNNDQTEFDFHEIINLVNLVFKLIVAIKIRQSLVYNKALYTLYC